MKEIIIDNQKYFVYFEEEMKSINKHVNKVQEKLEDNLIYPKIISFREIVYGRLFKLTDRGYIHHTNPQIYYSLDEMLYGNDSVSDNYVEIYQVQKSENEIFTLGDNVKNVDNKIFIINEFNVDNKYGIIAKDNKNSEYVEYLKHIESLFVTEDGIKITDYNQYVYGICNKANWQIGEYKVSHLNRAKNNEYSPSFNESTWKFFSTKEARDKYREYNMPKFSKKQIEDAMEYSKHKNNGDKSSIMSEIKFKEKLDI
jgi:hypothetical protein